MNGPTTLSLSLYPHCKRDLSFLVGGHKKSEEARARKCRLIKCPATASAAAAAVAASKRLRCRATAVVAGGGGLGVTLPRQQLVTPGIRGVARWSACAKKHV